MENNTWGTPGTRAFGSEVREQLVAIHQSLDFKFRKWRDMFAGSVLVMHGLSIINWYQFG